MPTIDTARRASGQMRRVAMQHADAVCIAFPTDERLRHAGADVHLEQTTRTVTITKAGIDTAVAVHGARLRMTDAPFERLARRQHLDPANPERNRILAAAGTRYRSLWTAAGLEPLQGQDPGKIRSTASAPGLLGTERQCEAFQAYIRANDALHRLDRIAVDWILLLERSLEDVGHRISHVRDKKLAVGIAAHQLRIGLEKLAQHFGLLTSGAVEEPF